MTSGNPHQDTKHQEPPMDTDLLPLQPIKARVLLVEDDPTQLVLLKGLANKVVNQLHWGSDGQQGLSIWKEWRPDVVVTDIHMPVMDGLEMSRAIKAADPHAQIIVLTSDFSDESLIEALSIGVERYVNKPIDVHFLADAITKCLRTKQQLDAVQLTQQIRPMLENTRTDLATTMGQIGTLSPTPCDRMGNTSATDNSWRATLTEVTHLLDESHNRLTQAIEILDGMHDAAETPNASDR